MKPNEQSSGGAQGRTPGTTRGPGRSFKDPSKPLGAELVDRDRADLTDEAVAKRAKAVAILRKAEEFMRTHNPSASTPQGMIRALELAAGRMGLKLAEYDEIVSGDAELIELERKVLEDARRRA